MKRLALASGIWLVLAVMGFGQSYRMNELVLPRGNSGFARGLNIDGAAAGTAGETHGTDMSAAVWDKGGHPSNIGRLPGGDFSEAFGINDNGDVVGSSNVAGALKPFRFSGSMVALELPSGDDSGQANAINNTGAIAGWSSGAAGQHAVLWSGSGTTVLPGRLGMALAVNRKNIVVGSSQDGGMEHAIVWSNGQANDLGTLVGHNESRAIDINDTGQVVGYSRGPAGQHAFFFDGKSMNDLGVLGGTDYSEASGINNNGAVVGTTDTNLGKRAFLWTVDKGMVDLNSLVPSGQRVVLTAALAINDRGQILAIGSPDHNPNSKKYDVYDHTSHAGAVRVYLLTPLNVP
jgi:probable HAF family extracellular repeat protein